jgi:hypothetical protein
MAEVEDGLGPAQDGVAQDGLGPPPDGLGPTPDGLGPTPTDDAAPQESTKKDAETLKKQAAKKSKEKWGKPGSDPAMPSDAKKGDLKYPTAAASVALGEAEIKRIAKEKGTDFSTAARHFNDVIKLELRPPAAQVTEPVEREAMATPETLEPGSQAEPQPEPQLEEGAGEQQFEGGVDEHGTDVGGEAAPPAADKKSVTAAKKKAKKTCNQKIKNPEGKGPKVFKFPDANNEWVQGEAAMKASDYAKAQQHFEQAFALSQEGAVAAADGEQWEDGQWEDGQWEGEQWEDEQYDDQQQWDDQEQWDDQQQYDDDQQQWDGQQQDDEAQWDEQQQDGAGGDEGQYQNEDQWAEAPPPGWEQQQQEAGGAVDELTPEEAEDLRYQVLDLFPALPPLLSQLPNYTFRSCNARLFLTSRGCCIAHRLYACALFASDPWQRPVLTRPQTVCVCRGTRKSRSTRKGRWVWGWSSRSRWWTTRITSWCARSLPARSPRASRTCARAKFCTRCRGRPSKTSRSHR